MLSKQQQQMKQQLNSQSQSCCNLWCSSIGILIFWMLLHIYPLVVSLGYVNDFDSSRSEQNGHWCDFYEGDDSYWTSTYYGDCDALKTQYTAMMIISIIVIICIIFGICAVCSFRVKYILMFAVFTLCNTVYWIATFSSSSIYDTGFTMSLLMLPATLIVNCLILCFYQNVKTLNYYSNKKKKAKSKAKSKSKSKSKPKPKSKAKSKVIENNNNINIVNNIGQQPLLSQQSQQEFVMVQMPDGKMVAAQIMGPVSNIQMNKDQNPSAPALYHSPAYNPNGIRKKDSEEDEGVVTNVENMYL